MKYTPEDDPDYNDLKAALEKVSAVVNVVNKKKAETENLQMLLEIQGQIAGAQVSTLPSPSSSPPPTPKSLIEFVLGFL